MPDSDHSDPGLTPQSVPAETRCPYCGDPPTDETRVKHRLQSCGYHADDITLDCAGCGESWTCGVPIGEYDRDSTDLQCAACDTTALVHFIKPQIDTVQRGRWRTDGLDVTLAIEVKCPTCYNHWEITRGCDDRPVALVGYPAITGATDGADGYGHPDPDPDATATPEDDG